MISEPSTRKLGDRVQKEGLTAQADAMAQVPVPDAQKAREECENRASNHDLTADCYALAETLVFKSPS